MLKKAFQRLPRPLRLIIALPLGILLVFLGILIVFLDILIAPHKLVKKFVPPSWFWLPAVIFIIMTPLIEKVMMRLPPLYAILFFLWTVQLCVPFFQRERKKHWIGYDLYEAGVKLEDLKAQIHELRQKAEELETLQSLTLDSEQLKALSFIVDRAVERQSRSEFWRDVAKDLAINAAFTIIGFILGRRF